MKPESTTDKCRRAMERAQLTYEEVGIRMGYPKASARQGVYNFLNGANPTVAKLKQFAAALGVDARDLI